MTGLARSHHTPRTVRVALHSCVHCAHMNRRLVFLPRGSQARAMYESHRCAPRRTIVVAQPPVSPLAAAHYQPQPRRRRVAHLAPVQRARPGVWCPLRHALLWDQFRGELGKISTGEIRASIEELHAWHSLYTCGWLMNKALVGGILSVSVCGDVKRWWKLADGTVKIRNSLGICAGEQRRQ